MTDQPVGQPHPRLSQEQFEKVREGELVELTTADVPDPDDRPDFENEKVPAELEGTADEAVAQASVEQEDPA